MPLFQDVGKKFAEAAKVVSRRTAEATEVVRLNSRVQGIHDEIDHLFSQIGKAYYAMKDASGDSEAASMLCLQVDKLQEELRAMNAELDRLKNLRRCPSCGEVQASSASFCASCGTKMPEPPKPPVPPEAPEPEVEHEPTHVPEVEINWPSSQPHAEETSAELTPSLEPEPSAGRKPSAARKSPAKQEPQAEPDAETPAE